jgi:hypothetical protein
LIDGVRLQVDPKIMLVHFTLANFVADSPVRKKRQALRDNRSRHTGRPAEHNTMAFALGIFKRPV